MWIYINFSGEQAILYGTKDPTSELLYQGANWVGIPLQYIMVLQLWLHFSCLSWPSLTNRRITHSVSLIAGGLGLISINYLHTPHMLILSMLGNRSVHGQYLAMPYAILTGSLLLIRWEPTWASLTFSLLSSDSCCQYPWIFRARWFSAVRVLRLLWPEAFQCLLPLPGYFLLRMLTKQKQLKAACEQVQCIFDLDGVLVDTAKYHFKAWKRLTDMLGSIVRRMIMNGSRVSAGMASLEIIPWNPAIWQARCVRKTE